MKRDDRRNSFVGNGKVDAILSARMELDDAKHPILFIGSDLGQIPGEDARKRIKRQTITITKTGGTGSKLRITLSRYYVDEKGDALASGVTVNIDGTEYTTTTGGKVAHNLDGATYTTLHDMIEAINLLPGFKAYIGDALTTQSMNSDDFISVSETNLPPAQIELLQTLYRDVSEDAVAYLRIGLPRKYDADPLQIMKIAGKATAGTGVLSLIRDDMYGYKADASHQEVYDEWTPETSLTDHLDDNILEGQTVRGPVVLKLTVAAGADYRVKYRQGFAAM